ncbi:MAG: Nif3-like dinuclear metal center hexameric protein [Deltaproteobacteria bacterium]|nr:Nif3-like dinuclear metal center hexameric protein [Deltaproteobacteria bacterium]
MKVQQLVEAAERLAPARDAEGWDNVGLLVGDPEQEIHRALLCIDHTPAVGAEAVAAGCDVIVAYHPPLFVAVKRVTAPAVWFHAARQGIAVYSFHTALDVAEGGTNDVLADLLGLRNRAPLRRLKDAVRPDDPRGMGRVGSVDEVDARAFAAVVKQRLGLTRLLVTGPLDRTVRRVAVCAGSCGEFLTDVLHSGVDLMVTGELHHHDALRASVAGLTVLCTLHSHSERPSLAPLARRLAAEVPGVEFRLSTADREPFDFL